MFEKGHPIFEKVKSTLKKFSFQVSGITYETGDSYACLWKVIDSDNHKKDVIDFWNVIRKAVNDEIGYPMLTKATFCESIDDRNPYTKSAIFIEILPEEKGRLTEDLADGDALTAAYINFLKEGGTLCFGNKEITLEKERK